jgi:hypothetical protein
MRWVLIRDPQGKGDPQALLSPSLAHKPQQRLEWCVRRGTMAVPLEEARAHLGVETQRQGNDLARARTTPVVLALHALITVRAQALRKVETKVVRHAAWYAKPQPTCSDAIALGRRPLWRHGYFSTSGQRADVRKIPRALLERLTDAVCYAA